MSNDKSHPGATQQVGPAMAHSSSTNNGFSGLLRSAEREREREIQNHQLAKYITLQLHTYLASTTFKMQD